MTTEHVAATTRRNGQAPQRRDARGYAPAELPPPVPHAVNDVFRHFACRCSNAIGSPWAFALAIAACCLWALTGPLFGFSDTWQLVINTGTTLITFLAVFLIQNSQNRDARAIQLKLDELLRAVDQARTRLVNLEDASDDEIAALQREFHRLQERAARRPDPAPESVPAAQDPSSRS